MSDLVISPVAQLSAVVAAMQAAWGVVRDLLGGTVAMRAAGTKYLPKWPSEAEGDYQDRVKLSTLFPAFSRTITTLSAKPFSRAITYSADMPAVITGYTDDIDMTGRNLAEFAADQMSTALGYGLSFIMVDAPDRDEVVNTQAAERAAGIRPYFCKIAPGDVLGWQWTVINGKAQLTQFRFFENIEKQVDAYNTAIVRQIKVLNQGSWEAWQKATDTTEQWIKVKEGKTTVNFVPIVPVYGDYIDFMCSRPPLIEMAYLNIKHWQSQSDQDNLMHFARVPILTIATDDENFKLKISGNNAIRVPVGSEVSFTEHSGAAIGAGKTALDDLKDEMRQAGAELLMQRDVEATATEVDNDASVGTCALQRVTQGLQDSLNIALDMMAQWIKQSNGGTVKLFNEFGNSALDDIETQLLIGLCADGILSKESLYDELQRRWNLNPGIDWATEKTKIDADLAEAQAQAQKVAMAAAEVQATANKNNPTNNFPPK